MCGTRVVKAGAYTSSYPDEAAVSLSQTLSPLELIYLWCQCSLSLWHDMTNQALCTQARFRRPLLRTLDSPDDLTTR